MTSSPCTRPTSTPVTRTRPTGRCVRATRCTGTTSAKFWALLKYEDIRFVSSNPDMFTSTKGITIPEPHMPEPGAGREPHLHRPAPAPAAAQAGQLGVHPRQVTILEPKVREIVHGVLDDVGPDTTHEFAERDRGSAADAADRRTHRCAPRGLGAVPHVVGRGTRQRRPRDRARHVRGDRRALRVLPEADRRAARRAARRPAVDPRRGRGRRRAPDRRGTPEFRVPPAGGGQRDHAEPHRAGHAGAHRPPGEVPSARRRPDADPGRGRGDAALEHARHAHGAHRDGRHRDPRQAHRGGRPGRDAVRLGQPRRGGLRRRLRGIQGDPSSRTRTSRSAAASTPASGRSWPGWRPRIMFEELLRRYPELELVGEVDRMRATMVPGRQADAGATRAGSGRPGFRVHRTEQEALRGDPRLARAR